jgi:hypothetical protein
VVCWDGNHAGSKPGPSRSLTRTGCSRTVLGPPTLLAAKAGWSEELQQITPISLVRPFAKWGVVKGSRLNPPFIVHCRVLSPEIVE